MTDERYLSARELAQRYGTTTRTIYRYIHDKGFPKPRRMPGGSRWLMSEILAYERQGGCNG